MKTKIASVVLLVLTLLAGACSKEEKPNPAAEAPPAVRVQEVGDTAGVKVDHPEQFPLVAAASYDASSDVNATGVVAADVSRAVPVISLASGRVVEVHAKLGDTVTKGQLLMRVQSADISTAYSDYRQAGADHVLAQAQLDRAKILLDKGAIAEKDYEIAVDAELKARVSVETAQERLKILGADQNHPSAIVDVYAPISGIITDQQTNAAAGVQGLASPNPFTISDLSSVWVLCDVYENDLKNVRQGELVSVRLNAYPDRVMQGRVSNIGPILDAATRAAKVRLEMRNPGMMRVGMFVTATFHGSDHKVHATVPASAILHLHDRDWVYEPAGGSGFRRVEVASGRMLPSNTQEIISGIAPGDRVVSNALVLQN
ncbi:MAG: efflux RND transporter periplasmic adaptor subunit, partial [Acidobacteriota bacterium]|nr:efflux RND transporter periplasmic adaptor subunit [Acidobacteriota bacterium]